MAGVKGRSGRKTKNIEYLMKQVEKLSMENAILYLEGRGRERFAMTKELAGKVLARRVSLEGSGENGEIILRVIEGDPESNGNQLQAARFAIQSL